MARETWTDERLGDLNARVISMDQRMEAEFSEVREEFKAVRGEMKEEFRGMRSEMGELRTEMAALNRTVVQFAWAVVSTIFLSSMGTIAALITIV